MSLVFVEIDVPSFVVVQGFSHELAQATGLRDVYSLHCPSQMRRVFRTGIYVK